MPNSEGRKAGMVESNTYPYNGPVRNQSSNNSHPYSGSNADNPYLGSNTAGNTAPIRSNQYWSEYPKNIFSLSVANEPHLH